MPREQPERSGPDAGRGGPGAAAAGRVEVVCLDRHSDARGTVFEPLDGRALAGQRNVHVVVTNPGCVRGNHVHRLGTEVLAVEGPARVRYRDRDGVADVEVEAGVVVSFTIPPGVPHAVLNTGDEPALLVAFRDREHDPADPDTEPVPLLEPDARCRPAGQST